MKLVYLVIPHLPVQVERHKRQARGGTRARGPLIVGGRPWDPSVVLDCSAEAEAAGVTSGIALARAALRCPEAHLVPANHEAYQAVQDEINAVLRQFTDRVETAGLGAFFLDVVPLGRRFPDDKELVRTLIETLRSATRLDLRIGLADARFTAEQAAAAAQLNHAVVVNERRGRRFLAPLPLTALPAEAEVRRRLALLGVHTLGELSAMPRNALIRQFGAQAGFLHDLASGADPRPIHPDAPPLELHHEMAFEPPTVDRRTLSAAADRMATAMAATLDRQGYQTQGLRIELTDTTQKIHTTTTSIEPPTAADDRLSRRCQALVGRLETRRPVEHLKIIVYPLRPTYLGMTQLTLFSATLDQRWQRLQEALRRLKARFGEFVVMVASLISPPQPRPITVIAGPDQAPRTLIWETEVRVRRTHRVRRIYEHWRVRRRWWGQPIRRDYYRLEDNDGTVRLVYRDLNTDAWWLERRRL